MNGQFKRTALALVLTIASAPLAGAQQGPATSKPAPAQKAHDMQGMDMETMMKQCADMRKQMKPGAAMTPDMRKLMSQCDEMDKTMIAPEQPYTPPAERRR